MSFGGGEHVVQANYDILYVLHSYVVNWNLGANFCSKMLEINKISRFTIQIVSF